ncbi:7305_t:CDS:2 [Entrophospora sp. SA101]|nr:7305_t:CDS:2 [Entrophospora sp. SA101]
MKPFVNTKKYPYTKKNIDIMVKQTALFLIEFFQNIWSNSTSPQHAPQSTTRPIKSTDHDINIEIDQLQLYEKVLIRGHWYHNECIQKMDFKCHYCLNYLVDGINVLSSTYNDRLETALIKLQQEPVPEPLMDTSEN